MVFDKVLASLVKHTINLTNFVIFKRLICKTSFVIVFEMLTKALNESKRMGHLEVAAHLN